MVATYITLYLYHSSTQSPRPTLGLTVSEPADILLGGQQSWSEGTLQGEVVTLRHPCRWEGANKMGFLLEIQACTEEGMSQCGVWIPSMRVHLLSLVLHVDKTSLKRKCNPDTERSYRPPLLFWYHSKWKEWQSREEAGKAQEVVNS